jgi:hypothetical protein
VVIPELTNRFRFEGDLKLDKHRVWQELNCRLTMRPLVWQIHSIAAEKNLDIKMNGGPSPLDVVVKFSDLQNPVALTSKLLGATLGELAEEAGLARNTPVMELGVKWDAREDSIRIGRTSVQVYRLHTRLMDRYDVEAIVSRAGEILRVDFSGNFVLINDRLAAAGEGVRKKSETTRRPPPVPVLDND